MLTARNNTEEDQEAVEEASVHVKEEIWENDKNCSDHSRGKIR